ncbi:MAG: hypothetical protein AAB953_01685 [Patescibacteria group bacterium]
MENKNLKNILVAAGLAVFAGVLTLGVNAAFGAVDAPSQNPADAALHSPRFNNVDVNGNLVNSTTTPSPTGAGSAAIPNPLVINDDATITGNLKTDGLLEAKGNLSANGLLSVTGDASFLSDISVLGGIKNSLNNAPLTIDDGLNVTGGALVNGDKLTVANGLDVGTDLHIVGVIQNTSSGNQPVTVDDSLTVSEKIKAAGIGDYNYVSSVNKTISNSNNALTEQSVTCPANSRVISCYTGVASALSYNYANVGHVWGKHFTTLGNHINNTENICTASVVTIQALDQTSAMFRAEAVCYNPNAFEFAD